MTASEVEALLFDVFGTVVDWRSGVVRDGEKLAERAELPTEIDWAAFADAWREEYQPSMDRVRRGEIPWRNLDTLHRDSLEGLLDRFEVDLGEPEIEYLNGVWHRLDPWPDAIPGLRRLRSRYLIAPLSNGHVRLLTDMAKRAGIPWDLVLSAELAGHYKPQDEAYLRAVDLLDLTPDRVMMVAAHEGDLDASADLGLRTAYVHRPLEWGPDAHSTTEPTQPTEPTESTQPTEPTESTQPTQPTESTQPTQPTESTQPTEPDESAYDVVADDLIDLAGKLDA